MAQVDAMRQWAPPVFILALLVAGVAGARALGLGDLIRLLVSLIPRWLQRRGRVAGDLLRAGVMAVRGLWGSLFGLFIKTAWNRLYLVGFLYVLAPLLALFLFFLPMSGAGYFGLHRGPAFTVYLLLVNLPFGIVTASAARAIIGVKC
jgi:hypothetical protein